MTAGAFLLYFLKSTWDEYRKGTRTWKDAECQAVGFDIEQCSNHGGQCSNRYCTRVKVNYKQGDDEFSNVELNRENECDFDSEDEAQRNGEQFFKAEDNFRRGFDCFAVAGDSSSVNEADLTKDGGEKMRDLFGKIFISIFILTSSLVCIVVGSMSIIKAYNYVFRPHTVRERPSRSPGGGPTEPGAAALGSLHIRKAKVEKLVAAMATHDIKAGEGENGEDKVECSICLDDNVEETRVVRLPECNHHFHETCITSWLGLGHNACPVCRAAVLLKEKTPASRRNRSSRSGEHQTAASEP